MRLEQRGDRPQGIIDRRLSSEQHRISTGNPGSDDRRSGRVPCYMMSNLIPEEYSRADLENSFREYRPVPEIERAAHVRTHPVFRCGPRIRFPAEVDNPQQPVV